MKLIFRFFFICFAYMLLAGHASFVAAQSSGASGFLDAIADSLMDITDDPARPHKPDSARWLNTRQKLEESRLNEQNLQMEIEQLKLQSYAADSLKLAQQKEVVDSLREVTTGVPVVVEEDTLFYIYTNRGGLSPTQRSIQISEMITRLGKGNNIIPDSVVILHEDFTTDVMYGSQVIISLTDKDGLWLDMSRDELAKQDRQIIVDTLKILQDKYSLMRLIRNIFLFILVIISQCALIWLTNFLYRKLKIKIDSVKEKYLKPIYIKNYQFLSINREENVIFFILNILRYVLIVIQLIISIPILFSIFPQTENLAMQIFSYILTPTKKIFWSIVHYIPNLFVIAIIWFIIHYVVKMIGYLEKEIAAGRLKINGFYPDWAKPTYGIIRFLLYAFMVALIYPYLPGSDSRVFQGISVFVGLIVSFGSSSAIGNLIAGMIITYMRPFQIGDRIKINDVIGNVLERTPIVTRIRTLKNEIVTIPNSTIMNSQTTNLSESARTTGLIIHLEITCGYETPWKDVHQLLLAAAESTQNVMSDPHPFVHEQSFNDFDVAYEINAYISDANLLTQVTNDLRQNIQDKFKEAGISILSPHYYIQKGDKQ
ncbi:MAG: mechanosensitive ion channel family protein [Candidatus Symbiothrix sp.]|jgi:small-conductance mechanosensitive channel|nr:mechanosensitive ion channel family protein [Candidatus Symbiothrix sp.]